MGIAYNPAIVTDGMVLCLDAANVKSYPGTGTVWTDLSGLANNGTLINGVGYNSDNNGSMVFDGVDDFVNLGSPSILNDTLNGNTNWSISYWVNPANGGRILDRGNIGSDPTGSLELNVGSIFRNNTFGGSSLLSTNIVGTGWNFVTLTRNSTLLHSWYLNGKFSNSTQTTENYDGSGIWKIGRRAANVSSILQGQISNILIHNKILTAAEVQQNFQATRGRYGI